MTEVAKRQRVERMAASPSPQPELCFADAPLAAQDVARGVTRLFFNQDLFALCEVPLPNGRRADRWRSIRSV